MNRRTITLTTLALILSMTALAQAPAPKPAPPTTTAPATTVPTGPAKAKPPSTAPADPLPDTPAHVAGVVPKAPPPVQDRSLVILIGGAVSRTISGADLAKVTALPSPDGGGKQRLLPLKSALASLVHKDARVTAIVLEGGVKVAVDEKTWRDTTRQPVLWQNRRGLFKLGWADAKGTQIEKSQELRDVRALEVVLPTAR